jgi:hypothetical protein
MAHPKAQAIAGLAGSLAMPDWRAGTELTAADLCLEQKYFVQRLRRHLRLVHGWGIVCGLNVVPADDTGWELFVCPGYGISPCGDEIFVEKRFRFNLRDYLWTRPLSVTSNRAWISIEAAEDPTAYEPAPAQDCGCGCDGTEEKPSRLVDGFRIVVMWTAPFARRSEFDLCSGASPPCPACPQSCALPLATVSLPS